MLSRVEMLAALRQLGIDNPEGIAKVTIGPGAMTVEAFVRDSEGRMLLDPIDRTSVWRVSRTVPFVLSPSADSGHDCVANSFRYKARCARVLGHEGPHITAHGREFTDVDDGPVNTARDTEKQHRKGCVLDLDHSGPCTLVPGLGPHLPNCACTWRVNKADKPTP